MRCRLLALLLAPALLLVGHGGVAWGQWGTGGTGAGGARAAVLAPPTGLSATQWCSPTSSATITFQGAVTAQGNVNLSFTTPADVVAGDVLVVGYGKKAMSGTTVTVPTGWTQVRPADGVSGDYLQTAFWRRATATDAGTSHTFTSSDTLASAGVLAVYRGVDDTSPVLAHSGQSGVNTASITSPSVTPGRTDSRLVGVFGITANQRITTAPTGMTLTGNIRTTTGAKGPDQFSIALGDEAWPSSGATGSRTATASGSATVVGHLLALKPKSLPSLTLNWTPTTSSFADGYALALYRDGALAATSEPAPVSTTSHTTGTLVNNATYRVELRTRTGNWRSSSAAEVTVTTSC